MVVSLTELNTTLILNEDHEMVARARRRDEAYDKYRKNLKIEAVEEKERLKGKMSFLSVQYFKKWIKEKLGWGVSKETRTYRRQQAKPVMDRVARRNRSLRYRRDK
jgi:hypothetical protein